MNSEFFRLIFPVSIGFLILGSSLTVGFIRFRTVLQIRLKLPCEECWTGSSDHAEFVNKRFRTCAIFRFYVENANIVRTILRKLFRIPIKTNNIPYGDWIHTEKDAIKNIDEQKLEETTLVVVRFIDKLNEKTKRV